MRCPCFDPPWLTLRVPVLDVRMALPAAVLIVVTIKSAYLSISCVDLSSGTSPKLTAASRVDSNTSPSVWSIYILWSLCVCSYEVVHLLRFQWVGDRCPSHDLLGFVCHV